MYRAPLQDLKFALDEVVGTQALAGCPAFAEYTPELGASVLAEAARLAEQVLDPLYRSADLEGSHWSDGEVKTPAGFQAAYRQFVAGGWPMLRADAAFGGQGMPTVLVSAVEELWASANLAFRICPMLTQGATEAIAHCGSEAQKSLYLPRMVRGEWTGTMNLTEPQAGSDLAQVRTRAVPDGDHYRIFGQKIFITYGEHDLSDNIIHLVLARIEGAPAGVKGISLFIVPKFLVAADGAPGARNDLQCVSIEHKLGIRGSPTCTMVYGQRDGAIGYLLGEANHGLAYMFVMMNAARLSVGLEGYALAERAYQGALDWARTRVQGRPPGQGGGEPLPIINHPDVRRMLLTMKSQIEAMRYLALYTAAQLDLGADDRNAAVRAAGKARGELLIPIVKGWCTESGVESPRSAFRCTAARDSLNRPAPRSRCAMRASGRSTKARPASRRSTSRPQARQGRRCRVRIAGRRYPNRAGDPQAAGPAVAVVVRAADEALRLCRRRSPPCLPRSAANRRRASRLRFPCCGWRESLRRLAAGARAARAGRLLAEDGARGPRFLKAKLETARFYAEQISAGGRAHPAIVRSGAGSVLDSDPALL